MANARRNPRKGNRPAAGRGPTSDRRRQGHSGRNSDPLTIGWVSNAPWAATGYGGQTAQVVARLAGDGHNVAVMSNYGLEGASSDWGGIKVFARGAEAYSNDVAPAQMQEWHQQYPDTKPVLVTLYDVWVFKGPQWDNWPIVSWVPIDHAPCPPQVAAWCARDNVTPLAMSRFGQAQLANLGIESIYVPHGIDTNIFKPTPYLVDDHGNQVTGRQLMGVTDDQFVVMFAAANKGVYPTRKAFAENLIAFKMFAEKHSDAVLYLHTEAHGAMGGINVGDLLDAVSLRREQVRIVDQYSYRGPLPAEYLAACYTGADVLLAASKGEGFGIHVPEAQACGTPVIVSDFTAQPELVGDGWVVDGQPDWDPMQRSWWITPNIATIVQALEQAYQRPRGASVKAVEWAQALDCDRVFDEFWRPALQAVTS